MADGEPIVLVKPNKDYKVGIICALTLEQQACCSVLDSVHHGHPKRQPNDQNNYDLGSIGDHDVVIATLAGGYGNSNAAIVAQRMVSSFPEVKFLFMVGIAGGLPAPEDGPAGDIRLGDIVVSDPKETLGGVVQWDLGRIEDGGVLQRTGYLDKPPQILLGAVGRLEVSHRLRGRKLDEYIKEVHRRYPQLEEEYTYPGVEFDHLYEASYPHVKGRKTCDQCDKNRLVQSRPKRKLTGPVIHRGIIASGNAVVKDAATRERIRKETGGKCVEMEGAGTMATFPCLVIRGICDYSDSHKRKEWQSYAALVAAVYTKELLQLVPGAEVEAEPSIPHLLQAKGKTTYPDASGQPAIPGLASAYPQMVPEANPQQRDGYYAGNHQPYMPMINLYNLNGPQHQNPYGYPPNPFGQFGLYNPYGHPLPQNHYPSYPNPYQQNPGLYPQLQSNQPQFPPTEVDQHQQAGGYPRAPVRSRQRNPETEYVKEDDDTPVIEYDYDPEPPTRTTLPRGPPTPPVEPVPMPQTKAPKATARYNVTAVGWSKWSTRVYFQYNRILYEAKKDKDTWVVKDFRFIEDAAEFTPLAVIGRVTNEEEDIRLYYRDSQNILQEARYTTKKGWFEGSLSELNIEISPNSKLAAISWSSSIRLYYQTPEANFTQIEELSYNESSGWIETPRRLITALSGTSIAVARYTRRSGTYIHLFYQDTKLALNELVYDNFGEDRTESRGGLRNLPSKITAPLRTPLTAFSHGDRPDVRLYWKCKKDEVMEYSALEAKARKPPEAVKGLLSIDGPGLNFAGITFGAAIAPDRTLFVLQADGRLWEEKFAAGSNRWNGEEITYDALT